MLARLAPSQAMQEAVGLTAAEEDASGSTGGSLTAADAASAVATTPSELQGAGGASMKVHKAYVYLTHLWKGLAPMRDRGRKRDRSGVDPGSVGPHPLLQSAMEPGQPAAFINDPDTCVAYSKCISPLLILMLNGFICYLLGLQEPLDLRGEHAVVQAALAAVLFTTGCGAQEICRLSGGKTNRATVLRRKTAMLPLLVRYLMPFIPWGVRQAHRHAARVWHQGLLPGCVGFVDGVTWPTAGSSDPIVNKRWYSVHHRMPGFNHLLFTDVCGRLIWIEPMGPGSGEAEVTAARRAVEKMRMMGVLGPHEFFVGDGVFRGIHPHVRPLAGPKHQQKLANRAMGLFSKQPSVAAALACVTVQRALERELTVSARQVVENCIAQYKVVGGVSNAGRKRVPSKPSAEAEVRSLGIATAGILAFSQAHGQRVPRSGVQMSLRNLWQPQVLLRRVLPALAGDCPAADAHAERLLLAKDEPLAERESVAYLHPLFRVLRGGEADVAQRRSDGEALHQAQELLGLAGAPDSEAAVAALQRRTLSNVRQLLARPRGRALAGASAAASSGGGGSAAGGLAQQLQPAGGAKLSSLQRRPAALNVQALFGEDAADSMLTDKPVLVGKYVGDRQHASMLGVRLAVFEPCRDIDVVAANSKAWEGWYYMEDGSELLDAADENAHSSAVYSTEGAFDFVKRNFTWVPLAGIEDDSCELMLFVYLCLEHNYKEVTRGPGDDSVQ